MNVKEFLNLLNANTTVIFKINNNMYSYFEVRTDSNLHNININKINLYVDEHNLTDEDVFIESKKDVIDINNILITLPINSYYSIVVIEIN